MRFTARLALSGTLTLAFIASPSVPSAQASFGFESFSAAAENQNTTPTTQAGAHPYALHLDVGLNSFGGASDGDLRELTFHLPPGLLINPTAVNECSAAAFHTPRSSPYETSLSGESCPNSTQVGVLAVDAGGATRHFGLFNLVPPLGDAAALGASPFGTPLVFVSRLRESDSGLDLALEEVPQSFDLQSLQLTIWGTPWEGGSEGQPQVHNPQRGNCLDEQTGGSWGSCYVNVSTPAPEVLIHSFLTMPTTPCGPPLTFTAAAVDWQEASAEASAAAPALVKCNQSLAIAQLQLRTANAAAATGLVFNLGVNDGGGILNPAGIARPAIKTAIARLPEGLTINPSLAAGLRTCTEAQWALETAQSAFGAGCPPGSKIGDVSLEGALGLSETLTGSVFLAQPHANPFHSLIAIYMVARLPRRGLIVKSQGSLEPDPHSGRLLATFEELPRLLYTHFNLSLREGQRSALVSPPTCGRYPTDLSLADWAQPTVFRSEQTAFFIERGEAGGPCPSGGVQPFAPRLLAGSINPEAGAVTPLSLRMTRTDSEQEITSYSASLPPGLLGKIAGIPYCSDAAIGAAKALGGAEELEHPSCPAASQIGHTIAGYGVGGTLAWAPGNLYLAGPYHGAPLSTVAVDSALIGPFDLGTVVVRSAIRVDPGSAQVSIDGSVSDPIPHILAGIPLHLRDIRVHIDRTDFTRNPTSCDPTRLTSTLGGAGANPFDPSDDTTAGSVQRYQLLNCSVLPFKPRLRFRFTSGFRRRAYPALRTELSAAEGEANPRFVSVTLPRTEFTAQEHLRDVCSRAQFAAEACPPNSVYGTAAAYTPLLSEPLRGPVYLRASGAGLPNIVFALAGPQGLQVDVVGRIDSVHESLRATFTEIPDAPLSKFVMTLAGGPKGLIQNEKNICSFPQFANARLIGHNNTGEAARPRLETRCPKQAKRRAR